MKISQLNDKLGIQNNKTSYTTMIINTANAPADAPTTYKISLDCLSNSILDKFKIITHNSTTNKLQTNTMGVNGQGEFDASLTKTDVITLTDVVTGISYDDTNKKFIQNKYATAATNTSSDVVTTATLLNDMDLNITQITNTAGKTLATIDEASGKVSATFQDIEVAQSQVTGLTTALSNKLETSLKGANSGLAELDASGHVPSSQLPSYVDDVIEGTIATFPATGETGKIYVDTTTNISYRWSGSQYVKVASDLALGETSSTAHRGDHGATAYTHATDASRLTTAQNLGLYKLAVSSEGHISSVTAVEKNDIIGLGIPAQDTSYSTGTEFTSGITKLYTSYGSGTDGAITQNAFTVLMANMIINFGLTVALPSAASITEDTTNGVLTVALSGLNDHCTVIIQKQSTGDTWTTYTEGDAWTAGDVFRVYITRTITIGASTFTNSGVIGNVYTAVNDWAPMEPEEQTEP